MKKKINDEEKLINFKKSLRSNIAIYEGEAGYGKTFTAKSEIFNSYNKENEYIYVFDRENEYNHLKLENSDKVTIFNGGNFNTDTGYFFNMLDNIYEKSKKRICGTKTIVYIDEFHLYCSDKENQLKFLEYANNYKNVGISFVLLVQGLNFMDELIKNIYILYSNEHYEINRDYNSKGEAYWLTRAGANKVQEIEGAKASVI